MSKFRQGLNILLDLEKGNQLKWKILPKNIFLKFIFDYKKIQNGHKINYK